MCNQRQRVERRGNGDVAKARMRTKCFLTSQMPALCGLRGLGCLLCLSFLVGKARRLNVSITQTPRACNGQNHCYREEEEGGVGRRREREKKRVEEEGEEEGEGAEGRTRATIKQPGPYYTPQSPHFATAETKAQRGKEL